MGFLFRVTYYISAIFVGMTIGAALNSLVDFMAARKAKRLNVTQVYH